jgi:hypothetical protein
MVMATAMDTVADIGMVTADAGGMVAGMAGAARAGRGVHR